MRITMNEDLSINANAGDTLVCIKEYHDVIEDVCETNFNLGERWIVEHARDGFTDIRKAGSVPKTHYRTEYIVWDCGSFSNNIIEEHFERLD